VTTHAPVVTIVDYEMGNLHSVQQACRHAGLTSMITASPAEVGAADGVILPGIGAMPHAVQALRASGMDDVLRRVAERGTPLFGICLGMQLLMEQGTEFGHHEGLGILPGSVVRFAEPREAGRVLKVPAIGWLGVTPAPQPDRSSPWSGTLLETTAPGEPFYFVHSYHVTPGDPSIALAMTAYGDAVYCSAVGRGNVFGCQFHPERSGPAGLRVYDAFAAVVSRQREHGLGA